MSPLYLHNGKLLISDNKLASNQNCCCAGVCVCETIRFDTYHAIGCYDPFCDFNTDQACAEACLERLRSSENGVCTGWQPGPFGGSIYTYANGVSLNDAVTTLQNAGFCDVIPYSGEVVQLRPPSEEEPNGYWDVIPPHITVRCCNDSYLGPIDGPYVVNGGCSTRTGIQGTPVLCDVFLNPNQFPLCGLKPGAIDIAPWANLEGVVFPCNGLAITKTVCESDSNIISSLPEECIKGPCIDNTCPVTATTICCQYGYSYTTFLDEESGTYSGECVEGLTQEECELCYYCYEDAYNPFTDSCPNGMVKFNVVNSAGTFPCCAEEGKLPDDPLSRCGVFTGPSTMSCNNGTCLNGQPFPENPLP
jgi:hypothetical protein